MTITLPGVAAAASAGTGAPPRLQVGQRGPAAPAEAPQRREGRTRRRPPALRPRVLLAEDDQEVRRMLSAALRCAGYKVVEVGDGRALADGLCGALFFGGQPPFDVIVSDIRMPGLTGLDALAGLRGLAATTPVVLVTAYADDAVRAEASRLGAHAFFAKPFDVDEVLLAVEKAIETRPGSLVGGAGKGGEPAPGGLPKEVLLITSRGRAFAGHGRSGPPLHRVLDPASALCELAGGLRPRLVVLDVGEHGAGAIDLLTTLDTEPFDTTCVVILSDADDPVEDRCRRVVVLRGRDPAALLRAVAT